MPYTYQYPRAALTVDTVIFGLDLEARELQVLLVERGGDPFKGQWAIPGGFVEPGEAIEVAAQRELEEECGVRNVFLEQLHAFGDPERDPREHVVTIAYFALVNRRRTRAIAGSDARKVKWIPLAEAADLAFDHDRILAMAVDRLRDSVRRRPVVFEALSKKFTLSQLQRAIEIILDQKWDKRNFRKKMQSLGILKDLGELEKKVPHRAAKLYRFDKRAWQRREKAGGGFLI